MKRMLVRYCIFLFLVFTFPSKAQKPDTINKFGEASFYDDSFHGLETSNGETYDKSEFTAAHRTLPFNTILLVTNKENNKSVVIRVNDRGPFRKSRILDLSRAAAKKIGMVPFGVVPVKIKVLEFLNPLVMADSLLQNGETWDCYGVKKKIPHPLVYIWTTENWKHAFYMASCLSLEYKLDSIFVRVKGNLSNRSYDLIVPASKIKSQNMGLISTLKSDGFSNAKYFDAAPSTKQRHDDRSLK
jgi:hypothetical protein